MTQRIANTINHLFPEWMKLTHSSMSMVQIGKDLPYQRHLSTQCDARWPTFCAMKYPSQRVTGKSLTSYQHQMKGPSVRYYHANNIGKMSSRWHTICSQYLISRCKHWSKERPQYPEVLEEEVEEHFTKGSGPGGQSVNKSTNACFLRHVPTGITVKCHETRSLDKNRKIARLRLQEKLDFHYNKENSFRETQKRLASRSRIEKQRKTKEKLELKKLFKKSLNDAELENNN